MATKKIKLTFEEFTALMCGLMISKGCAGNLAPTCDKAELTLELETGKWGIWDHGQLECWYWGISAWFDYNPHVSRRGAVGRELSQLQKKIGRLLPIEVIAKINTQKK